jgi:cyclopropane fatty-acyl-phospholipid synthase-like methyltransferase
MEEYHKEIVIEEQAPVSDDFYTPVLKPGDLYTLDVYKKQLDSLKASQE